MPIDWLKGFLLTALIFIPLERLLALHPEQKVFRRGWLNDLVCMVVNTQLVGLPLGVLAVGIIMAADWLVPASIQAAVAAQPYWLQVVEITVSSDLGFYLAHRTFHAVPALWKFHAVHHSIEELDWVAAARVHPADQILTKGFSLLPVFSLGFSEVAIGLALMIYAWQSTFVHSNVRVSFGPLRWVFASPEFHHWHHSKDLEARDKNFAGQLPLFDVLFGTLHMPSGRMPEKYGIDDAMPANYVGQLLYPIRSKSLVAAAESKPCGDVQTKISTVDASMRRQTSEHKDSDQPGSD